VLGGIEPYDQLRRSVVGVAACFTAGYALTRVPGISKVL
jgi:hypothetical protein